MKTTRILGIALVVQVALAIWTWWPTQPSVARPLIALQRDAIDEIEIAARPKDGGQEESVVLARVAEPSGDSPDPAGSWVVRSAGDYPALPARVAELLDTIAGLHAGAPIATQATSHEALSIGDDSYGRRLTLRAGDDTESWLVAPATSRSVYARRVGENEVYRAEGASEWSFRERASSYWDSSYVSEDPGSLDALAVRNAHGSFRFEKRDGVWTLADLKEGEEVADAKAIEAFVSRVASLRMTRPVGRETLPEQGLDGAVRVDWTITTEDQSVSGGYAVGADVDSDVYVKAVDHPFVVRVGKSQLEPLRKAERSQFVHAAGAPSE
jgi:hypothetical protein